MVAGCVFLSAIFLYLAFPNEFAPKGFWILAWMFATPFFYALERCGRLGRVACGIFFGVVFYSLLVVWFIPYNFPGYLFFVGLLTVQPAVFAVLYRREDNFSRPSMQAFYLSAAWVFSEYVRTLVMHGWSWNLAHSQAFNILLLQSVDLFGSWGLSFAMMMVNVSVARLFGRKGSVRQNGGIIAAVFFLLAAYGYGILQISIGEKESARLKICALQPRIDYRMKLQPSNVRVIFERHMGLTAQALAAGPFDVIAWPETAVPDDVIHTDEFRGRLMDLARRADASVVVGSALWEGGRRFNGVVAFDRRGEGWSVYRKQYLVPFTEYMPQGNGWEFFRQVFSVRDFGFASGKEAGIFSVYPERRATAVRIGAAVCSEDTIGAVFREFVRAGAGAAFVLLNDGWFDSSAGLILHAQNAIVHAAEYKLPVVRVANTGWTAAIDPWGRVQPLPEEPPLKKEGAFSLEIRPHHQRTLASIIGDSFCWGCGAFVIMGLFGRRNKRNPA